MEYAKVLNGVVEVYPYTEAAFRRDNSNVSFPAELTQGIMVNYGAVVVTTDDDPDYDATTHKIVKAETPILRDNAWVITKTVTAMSDEEIANNDALYASKNRFHRDNLLAQTDWIIVKAQEKGETVAANMVTYRQALRDITSHANWPHLEKADWPVKP